MKRFRELIDLWRPRSALADAMPSATVNMVHKWHQRDVIPAEYDLEFVEAARSAGHHFITFELLATIRAAKGEREGIAA